MRWLSVFLIKSQYDWFIAANKKWHLAETRTDEPLIIHFCVLIRRSNLDFKWSYDWQGHICVPVHRVREDDRRFCSAGLLLMTLWRGENRSTISWSVKVSSLTDLLLSLFCQTLLSPFSAFRLRPRHSLLPGPARHLQLPSGFFRRDRGYVPPSGSSNPFGDIFKEDDTGRDKRPNLRCKCRKGDSSRLLFIYKAGAHWVFTWPPFENNWERQTGSSSLSHSFRCLPSHYFTEMNSADL